jgi:hypothetical protein
MWNESRFDQPRRNENKVAYTKKNVHDYNL